MPGAGCLVEIHTLGEPVPMHLFLI
jgi:hypothetical protein